MTKFQIWKFKVKHFFQGHVWEEWLQVPPPGGLYSYWKVYRFPKHPMKKCIVCLKEKRMWYYWQRKAIWKFLND